MVLKEQTQVSTMKSALMYVCFAMQRTGDLLPKEGWDRLLADLRDHK